MEGYGSALPGHTLESDRAAHQSHDAPGDCQSQSGTTVEPLTGSLRLLKLLEESFLLVQCDADAGVADGKLHARAAVRKRTQRYIDADFSVLCKFDRIANQVDQDLTEPDGIARQVSGHIRRHVHGEFQ